MNNEPTQYKSVCRSCNHTHYYNSPYNPYGSVECGYRIPAQGRISLRPESYNEFGNFWSTDKYFTYSQDRNCSCKCYVPSDNLEFLEWCYEHSKSKVQQS